MDRTEFARRFELAAERSASHAAEELGRPVATPTRFQVLLPNTHERLVDSEEAIEALYLGDSDAYVFIDVAVRIADPDAGIGWIRPSAHHPRPYAEVWDPEGIGPFKAVGAIGSANEWEQARGGA